MLKFALVLTLIFSAADAGKLELFSKITKFVTAPSKKPLNYALRGKRHPKTGVRYNRQGYPTFKAVDTCNMKLSWFTRQFDKLSSDSAIRQKHFRICSRKLYRKIQHAPAQRAKFTAQQLRQLRAGKTPEGYTWHHTQKTNILTLVDRATHAATPHSGGFSLHHK